MPFVFNGAANHAKVSGDAQRKALIRRHAAPRRQAAELPPLRHRGSGRSSPGPPRLAPPSLLPVRGPAASWRGDARGLLGLRPASPPSCPRPRPTSAAATGPATASGRSWRWRWRWRRAGTPARRRVICRTARAVHRTEPFDTCAAARLDRPSISTKWMIQGCKACLQPSIGLRSSAKTPPKPQLESVAQGRYVRFCALLRRSRNIAVGPIVDESCPKSPAPHIARSELSVGCWTSNLRRDLFAVSSGCY